jgi:cyclase
MYKALIEGGASAVAAGALFSFTECTPLEAKRHLQRRGVPVRIPV